MPGDRSRTSRSQHSAMQGTSRSNGGLITLREVMIAAGHEDCDDIDTLKGDPAFKIACDREP